MKTDVWINADIKENKNVIQVIYLKHVLLDFVAACNWFFVLSLPACS